MFCNGNSLYHLLNPLAGHKIIRQFYVVVFLPSNTKSLPTFSQICMFIIVHEVSQLVSYLMPWFHCATKSCSLKSYHFILFHIFWLCQRHHIQIDALPRAVWVWVSGLVRRHESDGFLEYAANWGRALTLWWRGGLHMGHQDVGSSCQGLCRSQPLSKWYFNFLL